MNLSKLTEDQQHNAVQMQLQGDEFFEHLSAFSQVRANHERIYHGAFPSVQARESIDSIIVDDLFKLEGDTWDPEMRNKLTVGGSARIVAHIEGAPSSAYLKELERRFDTVCLSKLDAALTAGLSEDAGDDAIKQALGDSWEEAHLNVAVRLGRLIRKRQKEDNGVTVVALWTQIVHSTDELYIAAETVQDAYRLVVEQLITSCGLTKDSLTVGSLKDPVRVHEKSTDDYVERFPGQLPEACIMDILRARLEAGSPGLTQPGAGEDAANHANAPSHQARWR